MGALAGFLLYDIMKNPVSAVYLRGGFLALFLALIA